LGRRDTKSTNKYRLADTQVSKKVEVNTNVMDKAGSELMLINRQAYKALVDVLVQVHMRGKLSRDEVEVLKHFVEL